jgi:hypothetical protein
MIEIDWLYEWLKDWLKPKEAQHRKVATLREPTA